MIHLDTQLLLVFISILYGILIGNILTILDMFKTIPKNILSFISLFTLTFIYKLIIDSKAYGKFPPLLMLFIIAGVAIYHLFVKGSVVDSKHKSIMRISRRFILESINYKLYISIYIKAKSTIRKLSKRLLKRKKL